MGRRDMSEERKPEILENLYHVLAEEGLAKTTLAKVAERMGVNSGLLVHYFSTKQEMMVALVEYMLDKYEETARAVIGQAEGLAPEERMGFMLATIFARSWRDVVDQKVFFACYYLAMSDERIREKFRCMFLRFRQRLSGVLAELMDAGVIRLADPERVATLIIMMNEGFDLYDNILDAEDSGRQFGDVVSDMLK